MILCQRMVVDSRGNPPGKVDREKIYSNLLPVFYMQLTLSCNTEKRINPVTINNSSKGATAYARLMKAHHPIISCFDEKVS